MKWYKLKNIEDALERHGYLVLEHHDDASLLVLKEPRLGSIVLLPLNMGGELPEPVVRTLLRGAKVDIDLEDFLRSLDVREEAHRATAKAGETGSPIWDSLRVKAILERPEGTPIDLSELTEDESDTLAREAKGMWADHPFIKDSVEWVRALRMGLFKGSPVNE